MEISVLIGAFVFLAGLLFGSFLNVCIYRIPAGESVVFPPSHCPTCGHRLNGFDLIPVLSRILLKGKCRYCGAPVALRYTLVELLTAILLTFVYLRFGLTLYALPLSVLVLVLIVVSFIDIDHRIIPHGPLFFAAGAGILYALYTGGIRGLAMALLAALCGALPLWLMDLAARLLLKKDGMGMGDVKLMAAAGPVLGVKLTLFSLLGAVWTCALWSIVLLIRKKEGKDAYLPFGPFLAAGSLLSVFFGDALISWYVSRFIG